MMKERTEKVVEYNKRKQAEYREIRKNKLNKVAVTFYVDASISEKISAKKEEFGFKTRDETLEFMFNDYFSATDTKSKSVIDALVEQIAEKKATEKLQSLIQNIKQ